MLESLDKVDWSKLHHAYGEASDVPVLIRRLLSHDEDEREIAFRDLHTNIWHQGTIWEASSFAVPFLQELLKSSETPDKLSVAHLLANLATGTHAYYGVLEKIEEQQTWRRILAEEGKILEEEVAREHVYEEATRKAISQEFSLLYPYLFCEEPAIRWRIAKMLGEYPEFAYETLPLLNKALSSENDNETKKAILNAITQLKK